MDYKDYLEEAKKYLEESNPVFDRFEEYYKQAAAGVEDYFSGAEKKLGEDYFEKANQTQADYALASKNIAQNMAARGLSRSGEAEQEAILTGLEKNKSLSTLAAANLEALGNLYKSKNESLLSLEKEHAERQTKSDDFLNSLAMEMARASLAADEKAESIAREGEKETSRREHEEYLKRLDAELKEAAASADRAAKEAEAEKERAFKRETAEMKYEDEKVKETQKKPSQTPSSLAKTLVGTYSSNGKSVNTAEEKIKLSDYIASLKENGVAEDYLAELSMALAAMGFTEPTATERAAKTIVDDSMSAYNSKYQSYFSLYKTLGFFDNKAKSMAASAAENARLDYIYTHSRDKTEFAVCVEILGVSDLDLQNYLKRVNEINNNPKYAKIGINTA